MMKNGKKWKLWTGLVVLFLSGMLVGSLLTMHVMRSFIAHLIHGGPTTLNEWVVDRITGHLDLTTEQELQISAILADTQAQLNLEKDEFHPRIHAIIQAEIAAVRKELTPEQATKFDRLMQHVDKHRQFLDLHTPHPEHPDH